MMENLMKCRQLLPLLLAILLLPAAGSSQGAESRLERIKRTNTLVVSHGESGIPFSYIDRNGPTGFGVDISQHVADAIRQHLGLADLKIRWNPVTLSTRFPMIVTGTVDIECVTTTNTTARQKMVAFSNTFYISDEGIGVRRDSGITNKAGLAGKRIAVVRGTSTEDRFKNDATLTGISLVSERNNRLAMAALAEGRADAYAAAAPIIAGELVRLKDASPFQILPTGGAKEAFGCMLPKDDPAFKKVVDEALAKMMTSGEMERIYIKWFMAPIPPYGRTVGMPLSEDNRKHYAAPNDIAME
jgi:glutamate/aspartate transport system substrate-binding protein